MEIDLNRLHGTKTHRGAGQTMRMIANLIGNIQLSEDCKTHVVWIPSGRHHFYLTNSILDFAQFMDEPVKEVKRSGRLILFENGSEVRILTKDRIRDLDGIRYREFWDN